MDTVIYFAEENYRKRSTVFGIKENDLLSHTYVVGKTGTGKTNLLESLLIGHINNGNGCCLIDPHGDLAEKVNRSIKASDNVVYVNPSDTDSPWGYNPLKRTPPHYIPLVASGIIDVFKKSFDNKSWGARLEHILRNSVLTLLESGGAKLSDIPRLLNDRDYRQSILKRVRNQDLLDFWRFEYDKYSFVQRQIAIAPILNKLGGYITNPSVRRVVIDPAKELSFSEIMDSRKILIINLSRGLIGSEAAHLLGSLFLTSISLAAYFRARLSEDRRIPFFIHVDEFQNFTTDSVADMLSELRKYKLGLVLAHQYIGQLTPTIRDSIIGNVGTIIAFRIGTIDAKFLSTEFHPRFCVNDLISLPNYRIYLKLMIDGVPSKPFSATTIKASKLIADTRPNPFVVASREES
ncbi:MAG: type IV secretion system DNA-binding domain-containing protein [Pseudomonadota bacterium]